MIGFDAALYYAYTSSNLWKSLFIILGTNAVKSSIEFQFGRHRYLSVGSQVFYFHQSNAHLKTTKNKNNNVLQFIIGLPFDWRLEVGGGRWLWCREEKNETNGSHLIWAFLSAITALPCPGERVESSLIANFLHQIVVIYERIHVWLRASIAAALRASRIMCIMYYESINQNLHRYVWYDPFEPWS